MAKYEVTCPSCGAGYTVQLYGPGRDREWKLENWDWTCDECKEKARQDENARAAAANAEAGLPPLTGSEKQIAWAETIRAQKLDTLCKARAGELDPFYLEAFYGSRYDGAFHLGDPNIEYAASLLASQSKATWWIDTRDKKVGTLLSALFVATPPPVEVPDDLAQMKQQVIAEATVRPGKPVTETVAEIRAGENDVEVSFPEKREDFRQLVRFKLGYSWDSGKSLWRRVLKKANGTPHDRAAETGHRLLTAGFPIRIYDDSLRVHAATGTYEPESKRWLMAKVKGEYAGWFVISWPREEDFYRAAKRLPGSRYDKPSVVVPAEQFQEVLDFAEMYQFSISDGARKLADQARAVRERALVAEVVRHEEPRQPQPGGKPGELDVPENVDIADEFKED